MFKHHYRFTMPLNVPLNLQLASHGLSGLPRGLRQARSCVAGLFSIATLIAPWTLATPVRADRLDDYDTCRLVDADARPDLLIVREAASADASAVETLIPSERVTLDSNWRSIRGSYGYYWIEITEPVSGFVANRPIEDNTYSTLRNCPDPRYTPNFTDPNRVPYPGQSYDTTMPTEATFYTYCQEVVQPEGLSIRARPSEDAERLGGVADGRNVLVASDTDPVLDAMGRYWIAIDLPTPGYISGGYSANFENIEPCRNGSFR